MTLVRSVSIKTGRQTALLEVTLDLLEAYSTIHTITRKMVIVVSFSVPPKNRCFVLFKIGKARFNNWNKTEKMPLIAGFSYLLTKIAVQATV